MGRCMLLLIIIVMGESVFGEAGFGLMMID